MVYNDFQVLNREILIDLKRNGKIVEVDGLKVLELLDYSFSYFFYNSIFNNDNEITYYSKMFLEFKEQLNKVINKFNKEINTRQAVIILWDNSDEPPCFNLIQFLIRDSILQTIVYSRSMSLNKMRLDLKIFEKITKKIFEKVNCNSIDRITVHIGSFHQYIK